MCNAVTTYDGGAEHAADSAAPSDDGIPAHHQHSTTTSHDVSSNMSQNNPELLDKKAKKCWLRSLFTRAFTKSKRTSKQGFFGASPLDVEEAQQAALANKTVLSTEPPRPAPSDDGIPAHRQHSTTTTHDGSAEYSADSTAPSDSVDPATNATSDEPGIPPEIQQLMTSLQSTGRSIAQNFQQNINQLTQAAADQAGISARETQEMVDATLADQHRRYLDSTERVEQNINDTNDQYLGATQCQGRRIDQVASLIQATERNLEERMERMQRDIQAHAQTVARVHRESQRQTDTRLDASNRKAPPVTNYVPRRQPQPTAQTRPNPRQPIRTNATSIQPAKAATRQVTNQAPPDEQPCGTLPDGHQDIVRATPVANSTANEDATPPLTREELWQGTERVRRMTGTYTPKEAAHDGRRGNRHEEFPSFAKRFEYMAKYYQIPKPNWVHMFATCLETSAHDEYLAMPEEQQNDYEQTIAHLGKIYPAPTRNEWTYRNQWDALRQAPNEPLREFIGRIESLAHKAHTSLNPHGLENEKITKFRYGLASSYLRYDLAAVMAETLQELGSRAIAIQMSRDADPATMWAGTTEASEVARDLGTTPISTARTAQFEPQQHPMGEVTRLPYAYPYIMPPATRYVTYVPASPSTVPATPPPPQSNPREIFPKKRQGDYQRGMDLASILCYNCGEPGHLANKCPRPDKRLRPNYRGGNRGRENRGGNRASNHTDNRRSDDAPAPPTPIPEPQNVPPTERPSTTQGPIAMQYRVHEVSTNPDLDQSMDDAGFDLLMSGGSRSARIQFAGADRVSPRAKPPFIHRQALKNYYRPRGKSQYNRVACQPCDYDPDGSETLQCTKDSSEATHEKEPGQCKCKPGAAGLRCDRSAEGSKRAEDGSKNCEPCSCNKTGTLNFHECSRDCRCKANVEGEKCDKCKTGHIHLSADNNDGDTPCFCFGKSDKCTELDYGVKHFSDYNGWQLTESHRDDPNAETEEPDEDSPNSLIFSGNRKQYGIAPEAFLKDWLMSYGGYLRYLIYFAQDSRAPTDTADTNLVDVILGGNGISLRTFQLRGADAIVKEENRSIEIRFHETKQWYRVDTGVQASKGDFMTLLANVTQLRIRAAYSKFQIQSTISGITLEKGVEGAKKSSHSSLVLEQCECSDHLEGLSCQSCQTGFRRVANRLMDGQCLECKCSYDSVTCGPYTGYCTNGDKNTAGERCEICADGYYTHKEKAEDCRRCQCPREEDPNNFSPTCRVRPAPGSRVATSCEKCMCDMCRPGYRGDRCEECDDVWFGSPNDLGKNCTRCECSGNIDLNSIGNCDTKDGTCLKCIGNTMGNKCDKCKSNFYGSALTHNCRACRCHAVGAANLQCNNDTGICECKDNYIGEKCDQCKEGHGGVDSGRPACSCDPTGSSTTQGDKRTGQCFCRNGVSGKTCNKCLVGYGNFTNQGCSYCGCYQIGTVDEDVEKSDEVTGQCECKSNVTSRTRRVCAEGFYDISSGKGCQACGCDDPGSMSARCDQRSGRCRCKPGGTGEKCDKCTDNFLGLSEAGCQKCQRCNEAEGNICDRASRECVCPTNTEDVNCERCAANTWGHWSFEDCRACECHETGSESQSCDVRTGQCPCEDRYQPLKCDRCWDGSYSFPECRACECSMAGTDPPECTRGKYKRTDEGKCKRKANVQGDHCDQRKASAFSLQKGNPHGCTSRFCFGRSHMEDDALGMPLCVQARPFWQQMGGPDRRAYFQLDDRTGDFSDPGEARQNDLRPYVFGDGYNPLYRPKHERHAPLYWRTPNNFHRDKTASYNGFLRSRIINIARGQWARFDDNIFNAYPLVALKGSDKFILEYHPTRKMHTGEYTVQFREDMWRTKGDPDIPVTRERMMTALQSVQEMYIRVTLGYHLDNAELVDVSMDVAAAQTGIANQNLNKTALGVEQCECKRAYAVSSCQDPGAGHCRKRPRNYLDLQNDMAATGDIQARPCQNHSSTCDKESCFCTNCKHNTHGSFCDVCDFGCYGTATMGFPIDCKECACPSTDRNHYRDQDGRIGRFALVSGPQGRMRCDCKMGYVGEKCEKCDRGHYGHSFEYYQLSTHDSVLSAFEHSLLAMKNRLTTPMSTSEEKDQQPSDLHETRNQLYEMCKRSGTKVDTAFSPQITRRQNIESATGFTPPPGIPTRQLSNESMNSLISQKPAVNNVNSDASQSNPERLDKKVKKGRKHAIEGGEIVGGLKANIHIYRNLTEELIQRIDRQQEIEKKFLAITDGLLRVYIVDAQSPASQNRRGTANPYVEIKCGKERLSGRDRFVAKQLNPVPGQVYELIAQISRDKDLVTRVRDKNSVLADDDIGETATDLENRLLSKWRPTCGLPLQYMVSGPSVWRDSRTPRRDTTTSQQKQSEAPPAPSASCVVGQ